MSYAYKTKPATEATLTQLEDGQLWSFSAELSFPVIVGSGHDSKELRVTGTVVVEVEIQAGESTAHFTLTNCAAEAGDIEDFEFLCADALRGEIPGFEWESLEAEDHAILSAKADADRLAIESDSDAVAA